MGRNPFDVGYYESAELREFGFASVGENVRIAKNCNVVGVENIRLGDHVRIDAFTSLIAHSGHIRLGSYIHIGTSCMLGGRGGIEIEGYNAVGHGTRVFSASDDFSGQFMVSCEVPSEVLNVTVAPVRLEKHATLTTGCTVLPGVVVGEGAVAGAHSVITRHLPGWVIYAGSPATKVKDRARRCLALEGCWTPLAQIA